MLQNVFVFVFVFVFTPVLIANWLSMATIQVYPPYRAMVGRDKLELVSAGHDATAGARTAR